MPQIDMVTGVLRAAAILTNAYVGVLASSIVPAGRRVQDFNQLILYIDFTKGSLTTAEIKIEFNPPTSADLYQETDETNSAAANVDTRAVNTVLHQLSATGKYRLAIPIADGDVKVSVNGTGTVTLSSAKIVAVLAKTFA